MAITTRNKAVTVKGTGAVKFNGKPTVTTIPADNASTGAVEYDAPGHTSVDHIDAEVVVVAPTPGPVTTTVSWLPDDDEKAVKSSDPDVETPKVTPDDPKVETK